MHDWWPVGAAQRQACPGETGFFILIFYYFILSSSLDHDDELAKMQAELADVYKLKAQNDQQLIDANNRLAQLERDLRAVQLE